MKLDQFIEEAKGKISDTSTAYLREFILSVREIVDRDRSRWISMEQAQGREVREKDLIRIKVELLKTVEVTAPKIVAEIFRELNKIMGNTSSSRRRKRR